MTDYNYFHKVILNFFFRKHATLLLNPNNKKKSNYHFPLIHCKQLTNCYLLKRKHTNTHALTLTTSKHKMILYMN